MDPRSRVTRGELWIGRHRVNSPKHSETPVTGPLPVEPRDLRASQRSKRARRNSDEGQDPYAEADRAEAPGGRAAAGRGPGSGRGTRLSSARLR